MVSILYKTCGVEDDNWEEKLPAVLWAYRTSYKVTIRSTPFQMVYGQEAVVPAEFTIPSLRMAIESRWEQNDSLKDRLEKLIKLEERRITTQWATEVAQRQRTYWHDKHLRKMSFQPRQLVLKYNRQKKINLECSR